MRVARFHALGVAAIAFWLAMPAASAESRRFDGVWRFETSGNPFCYAPHGVARWTIRNGAVVTARGYRGTVDGKGRVRITYPGPYFGKMNVVVARLVGNQGAGTVEVEGTRCRLTARFTRVSG